MTHWHVVSWKDNGVMSAIRYDNVAKSISDYVDLTYTLFEKVVEEEDRATYLANMLSLAENSENYHIYATARTLTLSWTDCNADPCWFSCYN